MACDTKKRLGAVLAENRALKQEIVKLQNKTIFFLIALAAINITLLTLLY